LPLKAEITSLPLKAEAPVAVVVNKAAVSKAAVGSKAALSKAAVGSKAAIAGPEAEATPAAVVAASIPVEAPAASIPAISILRMVASVGEETSRALISRVVAVEVVDADFRRTSRTPIQTSPRKRTRQPFTRELSKSVRRLPFSFLPVVRSGASTSHFDQ
jgi:hypothetical protein